jgi:prepilin-type N-terminal cleavage/methylation domain-containing protein
MPSRDQGFTLLEILVAALILAIVLGIVATFFVQQSRLNRQTAAGTEAHDKARMVMQLVTTDLHSAGTDMYSDPATGAILSPAVTLSICPTDTATGLTTCIVGTDGSAGAHVQDAASMAYITTLQPLATACREVAFAFDTSNTLYRADEACDPTAGAALLATSSITSTYAVLAPGILALDIRYVCSNGAVMDSVPDTVSCPKNASYVRSALVSVVAQSDTRVDGMAARTFTIPMGQSATATNATRTDVTCGPDRACYAMTQQVLLPNLKDR